ncbi:MAG: serine--tRNA ligase [Crocinitomicaceae bacterium]|nr:serine--tRNA ligase [Crocinitomicaceae bacterium]|tara:strand:+ start:937 stop:2208 length:1272 start_codon:yes stop_codon:yes gene_type:complete
MLQIQQIRADKESIIDRILKIRKLDVSSQVNEIFDLDIRKRETQKSLDDFSSKMNIISSQIGDCFKNGDIDKANSLKKETTDLKDQIKSLKSTFNAFDNLIKELLYQIPNLPNELVPAGKTEEDNQILYSSEIKNLTSSELLPHWDLCSKYNLIDFELGVKITGAGFPVYKGKGAILQRALIQFFLNEANQNGFEELLVPHLVNETSGYGTGQLPDKEGQMYHVINDDLYLIPTSEVPITNIYRNDIIEEDSLPIKHVGYTPCFRREAGSYGKEVRGLNRLHQFDKVEIVQITHPHESYDTLDQMVSYVESLIKKLKLPYRKLRLCGGDLGFTSALTYDLETYSVGQNKWLEVSSISNFETFQSNRLKLRFRDKNRNLQLAHTLNGSALALPRIMASLLEINQYKDGIHIPEVLKPYTGFEKI